MRSLYGICYILDGTTYHFGSQSGGLIMYTFPSPRPDTTEDRLAFGLITKQSDCLILKLHSNNSQDLLKIFLKVRQLLSSEVISPRIIIHNP